MFKKLALAAASIAVYLLSFFVRKDRDVVVFGAWSGQLFADNSKYLYLFALKNRPGKRIVWITANSDVLKALREKNLPVEHAFSKAGLCLMLKASVAYSTHGAKDFLGLLGHGCKIVYLSHGFPFKRIGADVRSKSWLKSRTMWRLTRRLPLLRKPDICIASDVVCKKRFVSAYELREEQVRVVGFPRWEGLLSGGELPFDSESETYRVLYAPTVRGFGTQSLQFPSGEELDGIAALLRKNKVAIYIRPHPSLRLEYLHAVRTYPDVFFDLSCKVCADINSALRGFDCLVFDYSSIAHDFRFLGKPIVCYAPDFEEYRRTEPGLYELAGISWVGRVHDSWLTVAEDIVLNAENRKGDDRTSLTLDFIADCNREILDGTLV